MKGKEEIGVGVAMGWESMGILEWHWCWALALDLALGTGLGFRVGFDRQTKTGARRLLLGCPR